MSEQTTISKSAALQQKIAAMSDAEKQAVLDQVNADFAKASPELIDEFMVIMIGGASPIE